MDLQKLTTSELIERYSEIISELKDRKVIRTKNLIGDLAEYLVINHYLNTPGLPNLQAAPPGTQNVDALSRQGERYSIKGTTSNLTSVFYGLNPPDSKDIEQQKFEYVIIACFDGNFKLTRILELTWGQFLKNKGWHKTMRAWNISVTKKLVEGCKIIFDDSSQKEKTYNVTEIRQTIKNAYAAWSAEEDDKLEKLFCEKKNVKELAVIFGRNEGAIVSRIKKLELKEKYNV